MANTKYHNLSDEQLCALLHNTLNSMLETGAAAGSNRFACHYTTFEGDVVPCEAMLFVVRNPAQQEAVHKLLAGDPDKAMELLR